MADNSPILKQKVIILPPLSASTTKKQINQTNILPREGSSYTMMCLVLPEKIWLGSQAAPSQTSSFTSTWTHLAIFYCKISIHTYIYIYIYTHMRVIMNIYIYIDVCVCIIYWCFGSFIYSFMCMFKYPYIYIIHTCTHINAYHIIIFIYIYAQYE